MSGPGSAGKNVPKPNKVLPRVCGTRIFNSYSVIAHRDKNDRFWRIGFGKGVLSKTVVHGQRNYNEIHLTLNSPHIYIFVQIRNHI